MSRNGSSTLKVIAYTGGWNGPSGIFRVQQFQKPLKEFGVDLRDCPSWAGSHPPARKWLRPAWALANLIDRAPDTLRSFAYDLVLFQREMLSTFVTWEPLAKHPRILDVDDAIHIHRRGRFAARLAAMCDHVICGNEFLANEFSQWNANVSILPTAVDTTLFCPRSKLPDPKRPIIGWTGLHSGFRYLRVIEQALGEVLRKHPQAIFRIVSDRRPELPGLPPGQTEYIPWTPENQVRTIQEMAIGLMPLDDTDYARGKCSFKMLLYMACGLPVVVSPIEMNAEVLRKGLVGFGAAGEREWIDSLSELLRNPALRSHMGKTGREIAVRDYSVQALAPQLAKTLLQVAGRSTP